MSIHIFVLPMVVACYYINCANRKWRLRFTIRDKPDFDIRRIFIPKLALCSILSCAERLKYCLFEDVL